MEMDGLDDIFKYNRFDPSAQEAVAYYLPRLIAGSTLPHGADKLIHHADIYSCEPKDLAYHYAPAPQAVSTGDRFFFTTCKRKNGEPRLSARVAGAGTWTVNKTKTVYQERVKVGEVKNLSFKKGEACTGWVMEEYRCLLPEAVVADGEKVLCKIHLSPSASPATHQESAAYMMRRQEPAETPVQETVTVSAAQVHKRPAALVAAADLPSSKRMRMAGPVPAPEEEYQDCPDWLFAANPHVSSPAAAGSASAEAEDNMSCRWEEVFGPLEEESKEQAENNTEQAEPHSDWESGDLEELEMFLAADNDEEEELHDKEAEEFMAGIDKWCNNSRRQISTLDQQLMDETSSSRLQV